MEPDWDFNKLDQFLPWLPGTQYSIHIQIQTSKLHARTEQYYIAGFWYVHDTIDIILIQIIAALGQEICTLFTPDGITIIVLRYMRNADEALLFPVAIKLNYYFFFFLEFIVI